MGLYGNSRLVGDIIETDDGYLSLCVFLTRIGDMFIIPRGVGFNPLETRNF